MAGPKQRRPSLLLFGALTIMTGPKQLPSILFFPFRSTATILWFVTAVLAVTTTMPLWKKMGNIFMVVIGIPGIRQDFWAAKLRYFERWLSLQDEEEEGEPRLDYEEFIDQFRQFLREQSHILSRKTGNAERLRTLLHRILLHAVHSDKPLDVYRDLVLMYPPILGRTEKCAGGTFTILHIACGLNASHGVIDLLLKYGPDAAKVRTTPAQLLPLHMACMHPAPLPVIRLLTEAYPAAIRMSTSHNTTPVSIACGVSAPTEVIEYFLMTCPLAAVTTLQHLGLDIQLLLCKASGIRPRGDERNDLLLDMSIKFVKAMIEACIISTRGDTAGRGCGSIPLDVIDCVKKMFPNCIKGPNEGLRHYWDTEEFTALLTEGMMNVLLNAEAVKAMLREESFQSLISGLIHMNVAGRCYIRGKNSDSAGNVIQGVKVLLSVADNLDCLFIHLRENPLLCERRVLMDGIEGSDETGGLLQTAAAGNDNRQQGSDGSRSPPFSSSQGASPAHEEPRRSSANASKNDRNGSSGKRKLE